MNVEGSLIKLLPQAYRLEPLIIEAYASIKPVKVDSAGSKPSKTALDHAKGPKTDEKLTAPSGQSGSWMSSLMSVFTNPAPEPKQDKDKVKYMSVVRMLKYHLVCLPP